MIYPRRCYNSMLYPGNLLACLKWHMAIYKSTSTFIYILESSARFARASGPGPSLGLSPGPWWGPAGALGRRGALWGSQGRALGEAPRAQGPRRA